MRAWNWYSGLGQSERVPIILIVWTSSFSLLIFMIQGRNLLLPVKAHAYSTFNSCALYGLRKQRGRCYTKFIFWCDHTRFRCIFAEGYKILLRNVFFYIVSIKL